MFISCVPMVASAAKRRVHLTAEEKEPKKTFSTTHPTLSWRVREGFNPIFPSFFPNLS